MSPHQDSKGELRYFSFTIITLCGWNPRKCRCRGLIHRCSRRRLDFGRNRSQTERVRADFIGYTLTTYLFFQSLDWIKAIKELVDVPVSWVAHLSIYAKETLGYKDIDYAVTGEAEESLPNLLKAITKKEDLSLVRGIAYKKDNGEVIVTPREAEVDVNASPFPARHLLDNEIYYSFISKYKNFSVFITSRVVVHTNASSVNKVENISSTITKERSR